MKTMLLTICTFASVFFATAQRGPSKDDIVRQMSAVGDQHNAALDAVYNILSKNSGPLNTNASNPEKLKFLHDVILSTPPFNPLPSAIAEITENSMSATNSAILQGLDKKETRSFADIQIAKGGLNADELQFYNNLSTIIDSYSSDMAGLDKALTAFNESVFQKFGTNSNSTLALIAGSCVAKSSANYWYVNATKWASLKSGSSSKMLLDNDCGKRMIKSDIAGGVTGGISGGIGGAAVGGVGAVPGAVAGAVGGAAIGSTGAAVHCLLNWLWP